MMKNIEYMSRKGKDGDPALLKKYGAPVEWVQKLQIVVVYNAPDSAFSIMVDTHSKSYGSDEKDPISQTAISPFSKDIVEEIYQRLEDIDREKLTDEEFLVMIQKAHDIIAATSVVIR